MADLIADARLKTFLPSLGDLDVLTAVLNEAMTRLDIVTPEGARGRGLLQVTGRATGLDSRLRYRAKAKALFA